MTLDERRQIVASEDLRRVLGCFPTGMVVITAMDGDVPAGLAIQSFTSVSLDPPLIGFFPGRTSSTWPRISRAGCFAVNVLGAQQADLCRTFGMRGADRFAEVQWSPGRTGAPLLHGADAHIECRLAEVRPAGDHWFVLGSVLSVDSVGDPDPLVFFRSDYRRLAA